MTDKTAGEQTATDPIVPDHIRAAIHAGHVGQVAIYCDNCGTTHTADYTGETREDRFAAARRHLAATGGWSITLDTDLCPQCSGAEDVATPRERAENLMLEAARASADGGSVTPDVAELIATADITIEWPDRDGGFGVVDPGVPYQPDGIDSDSMDYPAAMRAAYRVNEWISEWGDGLIDVTGGKPLYARDLAALARAATRAANGSAR